MATTRIMPLHVGKGRTESRAISDIIDYVANPKKTDNGRLITGYACDSRIADAEFLLAKRQYIAATGRVRGADDVIAYHVRQSFRPGEITPEEANRLGVEFAKRFTKGNHAFVVCTHIDKSHIHNHIIWSSVSLEYDRKFRNFWGSTKAVRRLSDTICIENGLSIVENPKLHGKSYNKWLGDQAKPSHRELLRVAIDNALSQSPANFEELLKLLKESDCEVSKRGKSYRLKLPGWEKAARMDSLGEGYLFRSRLEARWAVFFDAMGIEWEYEPEGIVLSDGTNYLPDFYLPHFHCYFEVKRRSIKGTPEEERVISKISNGEYTDSWAGMICFGDPMDDDLYIFCQEMDDGGGGSYENPVTIGFHPETHEPYLFAYNDRRDRTFFTHFGEDMEDSYIPMVTHEYGAYQYRDFVNKRVYRARELARQARFEYGETPRIRRSYR